MARHHEWGARSLEALATCTPQARTLARAILDRVPFDCRIIQGHRGRTEQEAAFASGNSRAKYGQSPHNRSPSWAFDLVPLLDVDKDGDTEIAIREASGREVDARGTGPVSEAYRQLVQAVAAASAAEGIPARSGGDWDRDGDLTDNRLYDPAHVEVIGWEAVEAAP